MTAAHLRRLFAVGLAGGLLAVPALGGGESEAQETAHWYIGTYSNHILVWDEDSEEVIDRIEMRNFIPHRLNLGPNNNYLYVRDASALNVEIVDLERGEVVDEFTLSHDDVKVRIEQLAADPAGERLVLATREYEKLDDRYRVGDAVLLEWDVRNRRVSDTIPHPEGQLEPRALRAQYSPDGRTLYFFSEDIIAVDADTFEEVDRWELSSPLEPGLGRVGFGVNAGTYDEEGFATGLFRVTDARNNRRLMGIARAQLSEKEVEFYTVGPSEGVGAFTMAPGGSKAYGLLEEIGHWEFWEFDLENRRVSRREPFAGRSRMGLQVSHDGTKLYIFVAGNTIDIYDAETFEYLRTVAFDEDMTGTAVVPQGVGSR